MRVLVTGSSGHLGEALVRTLRERGDEVRGLDLLASPFTTHVGTLADAELVRRCARGVDFVLHAATLHKPHVATHTRQAFVETNVHGTLNLLEAALAGGVTGVVYTSTTSAFGSASRPPAGEPAAWITEDVAPIPRNIYGVTKTAAEELCELFQRAYGLPCLVLRTSRFFPEADDDAELRQRYDDLNLKLNEFLYRRVELTDAVDAHLCAIARLPELRSGRFIVSATSPFAREHAAQLRGALPDVLRELIPAYEAEYAQRGWHMLPGIDRVYVNQRAREALGWQPRFDFASVLARLRRGDSAFSELARRVGSKGYHAERFEHGPYPVERR